MKRARAAIIFGLALGASSIAITSAQPAPADLSAWKPEPPPAGEYTLDELHSTLFFRVDHIGFSKYTGQFESFDAQLRFDPAKPASSQVTVTIDADSLDLTNPPADFIDLLLSETWLGAKRHPQMTFRSTRVEALGGERLRVHGNLDFRGHTQPVVLDARFNGGYAGHPYEPRARIGFSARGTLLRSKFGMTVGIPEPGSTMGVSDEVEFLIEAEFSGRAR